MTADRLEFGAEKVQDSKLDPTMPGTQPSRRRAATSLLIVAGTVVVLLAMGRTWFCKCGAPYPWVADIQSMHNSQHLLDPYSFSHVQHGLIFFAVLAIALPQWTAASRLVVAVSVESAWEILENTSWVIEKYRDSTISLDYYGDSILNSVSDIGACVVGYGLAGILPVSGSVIAYVAIEATMLLTIRDSLSLNVVMLVHPIEWLKIWQAGG